MTALAVDQRILDQLPTFDAGLEDLEEPDDEPDVNDELDGPPVSGFDVVRPKRMRRAR